MKTLQYNKQTALPTAIASLQKLVLSLRAQIQDISQKYALLRKEVFGKKSEKQTVSGEEQLELTDLLSQIETVTPTAVENTAVVIKGHTRRKKHPGRNAIPENIKRERHIIDIPEEEKNCVNCSKRAECSHKELPVIDEVVRKVIERKPAEYTLHEYVRIKRACPIIKDTVKVAEPPLVTPVARGLASLSLLLFVLESKYRYHLPLYRVQRQIYHESQIWFTRSTMVGWIAEVCVLLKRVYLEMIAEVKRSRCIYSDDSRVLCVTREVGSHTSFMWVYLDGDGRNAIFDYRTTRGSSAPREFLKKVLPGTYLMIDENASYNDAVERYKMIVLRCWMHIRREFVESAQLGNQKEYALKIVRYIGQLYRIERFATQKNMVAGERLQLRKTVSTIIMQKIKDAIMNPGFTLLPQNKISKAINYARRNWKESQVYLTDGTLPIDNGPSERIVRDLAIGRNNWGSVGSDEGGKRMAILYSINSTCKLNGINMQEYLSDVLMRLAMRPENVSVADLTPLEWLKTKNGGILPKVEPLYPSKN